MAGKGRRKKRGAKKRQHREEHRKRQAPYPRLNVREEDAPKKLIQLVRTAADRFDFTTHVPNELVRSVFERQREVGFPIALREFIEGWKQSGVEMGTHVGEAKLICEVGHRLLGLIPEERLLKYIPFSDVMVAPVHQNFLIGFRSLKARTSPLGRVYHSTHRPTVEIEGRSLVVSWESHAIQQACARLVPRWKTYAGLGDAFAFFEQCLYFETCTLNDGNPAFTFYEECLPNFFRWNYVRKVLGLELPEPGRRYYYRVGYCPTQIDGDFLVGTTLLFPGYTKTPEYKLLKDSTLPEPEKTKLLRRAQDQTVHTLVEDSDFELISWFHHNGVAQVRVFDHDLYVPDVPPKV